MLTLTQPLLWNTLVRCLLKWQSVSQSLRWLTRQCVWVVECVGWAAVISPTESYFLQCSRTRSILMLVSLNLTFALSFRINPSSSLRSIASRFHLLLPPPLSQSLTSPSPALCSGVTPPYLCGCPCCWASLAYWSAGELHGYSCPAENGGIRGQWERKRLRWKELVSNDIQQQITNTFFLEILFYKFECGNTVSKACRWHGQ